MFRMSSESKGPSSLTKVSLSSDNKCKSLVAITLAARASFLSRARSPKYIPLEYSMTYWGSWPSWSTLVAIAVPSWIMKKRSPACPSLITYSFAANRSSFSASPNFDRS